MSQNLLSPKEQSLIEEKIFDLYYKEKKTRKQIAKIIKCPHKNKYQFVNKVLLYNVKPAKYGN